MVLVSTGALPTLALGVNTPPVIASIVLVKLEYWHKDHLGSLAATTDHTGAVTARYAYDPFGKRRYTNGRYDDFGALIVDWASDINSGVDRSFTGHEHLDDIGIVHMNGRLYDANIGRFLQGDPLIQEPGNLQSYNRYGYCFNNPLTCTDPSGMSLLSDLNPFNVLKYLDPGAYYVARRTSRTELGFTIGSIVIGVASAYCGPFLGLCNGGGQAAWAGFAGYSNKDALRMGLISGLTAQAFYQVGTLGDQNKWSGYTRVAAHAAVGCASSAASGGSCQSGALSAGFSEAATFNGWQGKGFYGVVTASVIGGTASVLGGGKFANGAVTGAVGYLFNALLHADGWDSPNGRGPNMRGTDAEDVARARLISDGYAFESRQVTATDGGQVRVYDLLMTAPDGRLVAIEVKSTIGDVLKLNMEQVKFDAQVYERGASVLTTSGPAIVRQVMYIGVDFGSNAAAAFSSFRLKTILESSGINTRLERSGRP